MTRETRGSSSGSALQAGKGALLRTGNTHVGTGCGQIMRRARAQWHGVQLLTVTGGQVFGVTKGVYHYAPLGVHWLAAEQPTTMGWWLMPLKCTL